LKKLTLSVLSFLKKISIARYVNFLILAIIIYSAFNNKFWKQKDAIIQFDVKNYSAYLPATFI